MLITTADNQDKAMDCGAIDAILEGMKGHIRDEEMCEHGCNALVSISAGNMSAQEEVCKKGGLEVLFDALKTHEGGCCRTCCRAIEAAISSQGSAGKIISSERCFECHKGAQGEVPRQ